MKVAIIGSGNVAFHLNRALSFKAAVSLINPHTLEGLSEKKFDIIVISVSDDAIEEVFKKIPKTNTLIVHTSGSVNMDILNGNSIDYGVFYPLQTFSRKQDLNYKEIPLFLEASNKEALGILKEFASLFSPKIRIANSQVRKSLHIASVFACNFSNALAGIATEILSKSGIDFKDLLPLMHQMVDKLDNLTPQEAQTGPAVREDMSIIKSHLEYLKQNHPEFYEIYKLISYQIQRNLCNK